MIKAVTFDCWNTLILENGGLTEKIKAYIQDILTKSSISLSEEEIDTIFADELVLFENHVLCHRKTQNARDRAESLFRLAGIELPEEQLLRVAHDCDHMALEARPPAVPGALEMLERLSESYRLGLICNTGFHGSATLREVLSGHALLPHFHHLTFSDEAGVAKPHVRIFQETLEHLGCRPEEAAHVGDSESADVAGAKHTGMFSILFTGVSDRFQEQNSADAVVGSFDELPGILESLTV
jgi:HAD superfamily hydrolase (TIGR01549 family)